MSGEGAAASRESSAAAGREPYTAGSPTGHQRFAPTEHLASEAIAAYVDGELRMNPYLRAAEHLARCPECAAEVEAQQQARIALRRAAQAQISTPVNLHDTLSRIPLADLAAQHPDELSRGPSFLGLWADSFRSSTARFGADADREFGPDARRWTGWWRK
jgi:anti-sigma factor RsiW